MQHVGVCKISLSGILRTSISNAGFTPRSDSMQRPWGTLPTMWTGSLSELYPSHHNHCQLQVWHLTWHQQQPYRWCRLLSERYSAHYFFSQLWVPVFSGIWFQRIESVNQMSNERERHCLSAGVLRFLNKYIVDYLDSAPQWHGVYMFWCGKILPVLPVVPQIYACSIILAKAQSDYS